jgi:hypothetical protein
MPLQDINITQEARRETGGLPRVRSEEALDRKRELDRLGSRERWQNPERRRAHQNARSLRLYGITLDERDEMERTQDGRCLICAEKKQLVVDHCHATGKVRGLLCFSCNKALGFLKDDLGRIERVINYLGRS